MTGRLVVIGSGLVGSTFAYTAMLRGLLPEIVLIDVRREKAEGDAMDLNHGMAFAAPMRIRAGDYPDCAGADIIVIAAGVSQKPGETRLDLLKRNLEVFREVIGKVIQHNREAVIVVATNPVDLLTYAAWRFSGYPAGRVIGSGTILDTARLRFLLGRYFRVDPRSIHAFVIGEHGDTEIPVWSLANIAGMWIGDFCRLHRHPFRPAMMQEMFTQVRDSAYEIIRRKGATYFAIALALYRLVECVVKDQKSVLCVSTYVADYHGVSDICLGVPAIVGRSGVEEVITIPLSEEEREAFRRSARVLQEAAAGVGLHPATELH